MGAAPQPAPNPPRRLGTIFGALGAFVGIVASGIAIWQYVHIPRTPYDMTGEWEVTNVTVDTEYSPFRNLALGYRVFLRQAGTELTGNGEKMTEAGHALQGHQRTPITITGGQILGSKVTAMFTEQGAIHSTTGEFTWTLQGKQQFSGSFSSTAANSRGTSVGKRITTP